MTTRPLQQRLEETCALAVARWGSESQVRMVIEECAELTVALLHHLRGRASLDDVASELADVIIVTAQLQLILERANVDLEPAISRKLERLRRLLEHDEMLPAVCLQAEEI